MSILRVRRVRKLTRLSCYALKKQKKFQLTDFKFAEEGYFKGNKFFKLERGNNHPDGVSGVLAPYAVSNDNVIAAMLLGCFVMAMVAFSLFEKFHRTADKEFPFV